MKRTGISSTFSFVPLSALGDDVLACKRRVTKSRFPNTGRPNPADDYKRRGLPALGDDIPYFNHPNFVIELS